MISELVQLKTIFATKEKNKYPLFPFLTFEEFKLTFSLIKKWGAVFSA